MKAQHRRENRILQVEMRPEHDRAALCASAARQAGLAVRDVGEQDIRILRKSLDARNKKRIHWLYTLELFPAPADLSGVASLLPQIIMPALHPADRPRPMVVGTGPAGLFAALYLAMAGRQPLLIERGQPIEQRQLDVARFWHSGQLDPESNIQFGEGGAGTFSDGKLTTGIKDPFCRAVLEELVLAGAPDDLLYAAKPHVGTDVLRSAMVGLRRKILAHGGEIRYRCRLTGIDLASGRLRAAHLDEQDHTVEVAVDQLILATGHSARDVFTLLNELKVPLAAKPFSLGVRIEHPQALIDKSQYDLLAGNPGLPPAEYKLVCHLADGRSVYTFCMCPGGQVVAASSEPGGVVTNGMSHRARNLAQANSALLVGVTPADFPGTDALAGMRWQRAIEQSAFQTAGSTYDAPVQTVGDFLGGSREVRHDRPKSQPGADSRLNSQQAAEPSYRPGISWCDLDACLPPFVCRSLRDALPQLERKLAGFADPGAVLTGVETRSSSPVRILRADNRQSALCGLYPAGEGAGYAGGIMSAAVDGLRSAETVLLAAR